MGHSVLAQEVTMTDSQTEEGRFAGKISCKAKVDRLSFQICATISYVCAVKAECSRCTESFDQEVKGSFTVVLQDEASRDSGALDEGDSIDRYFTEEDDEIDLRDILYDEIMTSVPIMPLCSQDCRGVAVEENQKPSEERGPEKQSSIDPRWEALKKLKK
jgi:uncharacterized protein